MDERTDHDDPADDELWSEAIWSAGLIGSVLLVITLMAQFA